MIIKLFLAPTRGWLLIAEQLDDPQSWDRFLPCHTATSERYQFDCAVKTTTGSALKVTPCKDLLKRGTSIFEYDWQADEGDILCHALNVAEIFELELSMDAPTSIGTSAGRPAA